MPLLLEFRRVLDRKSTRLNSSHTIISYAVFCLKKTKIADLAPRPVRPPPRGAPLRHPARGAARATRRAGSRGWGGGRQRARPWSRFFFNDTATTEIYTLSLHDALPILQAEHAGVRPVADGRIIEDGSHEQLRSEEHTSELQSHDNLVCRLLLEKKT